MHTPQKRTRIAVVYDWLDSQGGVERVLTQLLECFPDADIITAHYTKNTASMYASHTIHASFMQYMPHYITRNRILSLPFYPRMWELFDFSDYDLVISVTSAFAKGIITKPSVRHITYLLTPTRFLWSGNQSYFHTLMRIIAAPYIAALRKLDFIASARPDVIYSISNTVANRCKQYYRRDSEVVYPGIDITYWKSLKKKVPKELIAVHHIPIPKKYFLVVSRLVSYKKIDHVIEACNRQKDMYVVIAGIGPEMKKLQRHACKRVSFLGYVSDTILSSLYTHAEALLMPQQEDFGLVALEAIAHQCPVIAYQQSGVSEIISDGKTGILYQQQTVQGLLEGIARFHTLSYNRDQMIQNSANTIRMMSKEMFQKQWKKIVAYQLHHKV